MLETLCIDITNNFKIIDTIIDNNSKQSEDNIKAPIIDNNI